MERGDDYRRSTPQSLDGKLQPGRDWRMEVTDEFANALYVINVSANTPSD